MGGRWISISMRRTSCSSRGLMSHSAPSQSHFKKSHPPLRAIRSRSVYVGETTRQSSQVISCGFPGAECSLDHLHGNPVCSDILPKRVYGYRLHGSDPGGYFCSPDREPADIGADVKDPVARPEVIEAVL